MEELKTVEKNKGIRIDFIKNCILDNLDRIVNIKVQWLHKQGSIVKRDEVLGKVIYVIQEHAKTKIPLYRLFVDKNTIVEVEKTYDIVSPCEGFFYIKDLLRYSEDENGCFVYEISNIDEIVFYAEECCAFIFETIQRLLLYHYRCEEPGITVDPYKKTKSIYFGFENSFYLEINEENSVLISLELGFENDNAVLIYISGEKLHKGDCVSFLLENGEIIDYLVQKESIKDIIDYKIFFILYQEDIDLLSRYAIESYRITYKKESKPPKNVDSYSFDYELGYEYRLEEQSAYVKNYINTLAELLPDYKLPRRLSIKNTSGYDFDGCYVYLMRDFANGYHKIGISNSPVFREKTLQSEKPTIEMLASKKFPTRKIAESIESALHSAYSQKRLRGEWFDLDDIDVAAILETLK